MDEARLMVLSEPENMHHLLVEASGFSDINKALEHLTEIAKTADGRLELASKGILPVVLQLCQTLSYPSHRYLLVWSLRLLRNLCAGERKNQDAFIKQNGVQAVSATFRSVGLDFGSDCEIIRFGMQIVGNVSLAGEGHLSAVWHQFFPILFLDVAKVPSRETCDPLCMVLYTCSEGSKELFLELCSDQGLHIIGEIIETAAEVGLREDWLKLLLSRICLDESHFTTLFCKLGSACSFHKGDATIHKFANFVYAQKFLLQVLSEIISERIGDISVSIDFAECVFGIFKRSVEVIDFSSRGKSRLPTGYISIDVLGYSLVILRDVCADDSSGGFKEGCMDIIDSLLRLGLLDLLLSLLLELEPPSILRRIVKQGENHEGTNLSALADKSKETVRFTKLCPYQGFRRDLVSVIGNCAYRRKHVQDTIRERNAILCLLQQCVIDEDSSYLREWGIWAVRNILEGNQDNQQVVRELEIRGSVDVPEISGIGLRVEVDEKTRRPKLVNS